MYTEMTVVNFLNELASASPAPGGGSVSALAGSLGASLVAMVALFTAGRGASEEEERLIQQHLQEAKRLQQHLREDIDGDTAAYNGVTAAYRMPKKSEEEKAARTRSIQEALQEATRFPLQVAQKSLEVLQLCPWALAQGNPNTWSDAAVAALMAQGGIEGALANVAINLEGIKDDTFAEKAKEQAGEIRNAAKLLQEEISKLLRERHS